MARTIGKIKIRKLKEMAKKEISRSSKHGRWGDIYHKGFY